MINNNVEFYPLEFTKIEKEEEEEVKKENQDKIIDAIKAGIQSLKKDKTDSFFTKIGVNNTPITNHQLEKLKEISSRYAEAELTDSVIVSCNEGDFAYIFRMLATTDVAASQIFENWNVEMTEFFLQYLEEIIKVIENMNTDTTAETSTKDGEVNSME